LKFSLTQIQFTLFTKFVFPRPYIYFVPSLQFLARLPTTWLIGNVYFSKYLILPQQRLSLAPHPLLVLVPTLVLIISKLQGGGLPILRNFPNEQGSSMVIIHQPNDRAKF
jgi:hypothetical protein